MIKPALIALFLLAKLSFIMLTANHVSMALFAWWYAYCQEFIWSACHSTCIKRQTYQSANIIPHQYFIFKIMYQSIDTTRGGVRRCEIKQCPLLATPPQSCALVDHAHKMVDVWSPSPLLPLPHLLSSIHCFYTGRLYWYISCTLDTFIHAWFSFQVRTTYLWDAECEYVWMCVFWFYIHTLTSSLLSSPPSFSPSPPLS